MASNEKKQMTFETALDLLKGDILNYPQSDLDEAIRIVQEKDPNNHILKTAQNKLETYAKENNLTENNSEVYLSNINYMENAVKSYNYQEFIEQNKDIKSYVSSIDLMENENGVTKKLSPKRKEEYLSLLYEAAVLKAQATLAGSPEYAQKTPEEKEQLIKEEIKNTFFADFARVAISPYIKMPTKKEEKLGTKENRQYILQQVQNAANAFKSLITGKKHIQVHTDYILSSYADSASQIETYIKNIKDKAKKSVNDGFNKVAKFFQDKKNKFEKAANFISKNKYEIWKNIKGNFKDNKIKLIGNISASTAFGFVTAGIAAGTVGVPMTAAVGAYAAYHIAGSWIYPVIAEMRKINRQRREKGLPTLKFKEQLKQAWKNKTSKDEEKNSYKARNTYIVNGVVNTSLAAVGFGFLKNGLEAIDNVKTVVDGVQDSVETAQNVSSINIDLANSIADARHAVSMGRIAIPLAGQLSDAAVTYAISAVDPDNKEKAEEAKQTAVAALVGVGFSALAQGIGYGIGHGVQEIKEAINNNETGEVLQTSLQDITSTDVAQQSQESGASFFSKFKSFFTFGPKETPSALANTTETELTAIEYDDSGYIAADNNPTSSSGYTGFPDSYDENMGISKREYNILIKTTEGTLKSATGEEITLDRAYLNLTDETMAHFPDQTREEILYNFNRLYAFMRKAYEVGDGVLRETPSGPQYLENRFMSMNLKLNEEQMDTLVSFAQNNTYDSTSELKEGLKSILPEGTSDKTISAVITTIHSNQRFYQYAEEMENLTKLLGCGEEISAQEAVKINALLEQTDKILATGKANTVFTGLNLSKGCLDDDGEWRKLPDVQPIAEPEPVVPPTTEPVVEPEPEPEPTPKPQATPKLKSMPEPKPIEQPVPSTTEEIVVTKSVSSNVHGISDAEYADKSKIIEGNAAQRWADRANETGPETIITQNSEPDSIPQPATVSEPVAQSTSEEVVVTKSSSTNVHGIGNREHADKSKVLEGAGRRWSRKLSR